MKAPFVFIPNVTTPTNLGDAAMYKSLRELIRRAFPQARVAIGTGDPQLQTDTTVKKQLSVFDWMIMDRRDPITRIIRMLWVSLYYVSYVWRMPWLRQNKALSDLLVSYEQADLVVTVGCGFLRARPGISQAINLFLVLFLFRFAKVLKKQVIVSPLSFGPFAYEWEARMCAQVLDGFTVVGAREEYSYMAMQKYGVKNVVLSCDQALLLPKRKGNQSKRPVVGFVIRPWLPLEGQNSLEKAYALALFSLQQKTDVELLPIVQVQAPYAQKEDDSVALARVVSTLDMLGARVRKPIILRDISHAEKTYGATVLVLGMRMHANIISATQYVPFVAIAYEYKTQGIAGTLGMNDFVLPCEDVTPEVLSGLLERAFRQRTALRTRIKSRVLTLQRTETEKWVRILRAAL